jgi:hypothetical protein
VPAAVAAAPNMGDMVAPLSDRICQLADDGLLTPEIEGEIMDNIADWLEWGAAKKLIELCEPHLIVPFFTVFLCVR